MSGGAGEGEGEGEGGGSAPNEDSCWVGNLKCLLLNYGRRLLPHVDTVFLF